MWTIVLVVLVAAVPVAAGAAGIGWIVKKRGLRRWQWDSDMMKVQAAASAVVVFACSMVVLWMPMMGVVLKPLMEQPRSHRPPTAAVAMGLAVVPSLVVAVLAYWLGVRFYAGSIASDDEAGQKARKGSRRVAWSMILTAVLLLLFLSFWYGGDLLIFLMSIFALGPAVLLVLVGLTMVAAGRRFGWVGARACGKWFLMLSLLWGSVSLSYPVGWQLMEWQVDSAKAYCESLVPRLEAYKAEHGSYPGSVSMVTGDRKPPRGLLKQTFGFYHGGGNRFEFTVDDSRQFGFWVYSSGWPKWYVD